MKTYQELVAWVEKNIPKERLEHDSPQAAVLWWAATQYAYDYMNCPIKDLAYMFLNGIEAINERDVEFILNTKYENNPKQLEIDLRLTLEIK